MRILIILLFGCSSTGSTVVNVGGETDTQNAETSSEETDETAAEDSASDQDTSSPTPEPESEPESEPEPDPEPVDSDGDGYFDTEDCDDSDPDVYPGSIEKCDGIDNNCNDEVDEEDVCPCPYGTYEGKDYYFCTDDPSRWTRARNQCQNLGISLVSIGDENENTWLLEQTSSISPEGTWWIGLNDRGQGNEDNFSWVSGETFDYENWNDGEPNNWESQEDCVEFYDNGLWNDASCQKEQYFICESE
ncbi:MAG: lectin-like protein [Myxococcota bacterium]|nr:lectin-like protein [Myxococcota bacterium]